MKVLDHYVFRLWVGPFLGGLFLVLGVLLLGRTLKLLGEASGSAQAWVLIGDLLVLTIPYFLLLTVPMAFYLSMQNTVAVLQQNSEMDALRASGISYRRIFRSLFVIAILIYVGLTYTSMIWLPQGQLGFNNILVKMYALKGALTFSPQRFTQGVEGMTVYVEGEDAEGAYQGVILEDRRGGIPVIYTAESARFEIIQGRMVIKMTHGTRMEGQGPDQRILAFEQYQVAIPRINRWKRYQSSDHVTMMSAGELWRVYQTEDNQAAVAEWNRRLLLPTTVLILFFFALPLSLTQKRSGKAGSLVIGIALLVLLYNIQLTLHRQVNQGVFPGWAMWAGQCSLLALGIYLWLRAEADRLPKVFTQAGEWMYLVHQTIMRRLAYRSDKH